MVIIIFAMRWTKGRTVMVRLFLLEWFLGLFSVKCWTAPVGYLSH